MLKFVGVTIVLALFFCYCANGQNFSSSNLPILQINTNGQVIPDNDKITAKMTITDNGLNKENRLADKPNNYNGIIGIELRGSSSQSLSPKKPFSFETRDSLGNAIDVPLMGLGAENDWVLLAPYADKSLIRDAFTYDIARLASKNYWIPKYRFCEVFLNGQYEGVYLLLEKIKKGKNRVDISSLKPTDNSGDALTGGYIIKLDKFTGSPSKLFPSNVKALNGADVLYQIDYPKLDDITDNQAKYIQDYVNAFENTLRGSTFRDPVNGYQKFVNLDSFIDYFLVTELSKNVDGFRFSTYFYKNKDSKGGKLTMGPLWDYNLSFGNGDFCDCWKHTGFQFQQYKVPNCTTAISFWWERLLQDSTFARKTVARWQTLRKTVWNTDRLITLIDSSAGAIVQPQIRNFQRWPILGIKVWPNYYIGRNYADEIVQFKTFLRNRLTWLDDQLPTFYELPTAIALETLLPESILDVSPNPLIDKALISFYVPKPGQVTLEVFGQNGQKLATLLDLQKPQGKDQIEMNTPLPKGIFYLKYTLNTETLGVKKILGM